MQAAKKIREDEQIEQKNTGFIGKALNGIERVGNRLPDPIMLFVILSGIIIVASAIISQFGITVADPKNPGEVLQVQSLLSKEGIAYLFQSMVTNFTNFAPLGTVLVTMLGIGIAERSGLIGASLRGLVTAVPTNLVTAALVFGGVMSSMASDAGYVVLTPLGGVIFAALGRHPLAGIAAAFAGVSGGYSANLFLTSLDPLLGGITQQAVEPFNPEYAAGMNYAMNIYFMIASVFLITILGTIVTNKIVEPRLGKYTGGVKEKLDRLTAVEKKGLKLAGLSIVLTTAALSLLVLPEWGPLRGEGSIIDSPFMSTLVPVILILFLVPGIVYGRVTKTFRKGEDISNGLSDTMATMGSYIVLAFVAGQFIAYFTYTNLGIVLAVNGAEMLEASGLKGLPLIIAFIFVSAFINLFIGSASAKWLIMAPVFVPIMMQFGYTPEFTQLAYRIADSTTNIISPLMAYFAIVIAFAQKYDKKAGIGTLISTMLPYSLTFLLGWIVMLLVWIFLKLPLGPGTEIFM